MRRHYLAITTAALVVSGLVTSNLGCGGDSPPASSTGDAELAADVTPSDVGPRDSGPRDTDEADGDSPDTGVGDVASDAEGDAPFTGRTLTDYRRCTSNLDCPVGLGTCVKQVTLNRPDADGTETIAINEIFSGLGADEGVCSLECTNNPGVCAELSMNGTTADPAAHTCQLITTGEAPYPTNAPSLPLDEPIEPAEMAAGQPFAAICRPPFELDEQIDDSFCEPCDGPDACGDDGLCWSLTDLIPAQAGQSGLCLTPCTDDASCPLGFVCDATDDASQTYCRPETYTCTNCRDHDGDGFGTGHCGTADDLVTAHDCDDRDDRAYYDPDAMDHPFPATCGPQDFNCNGLSDDAEVTSADIFPADHCGSCFSTCTGDILDGNGVKTAEKQCVSDPSAGATCTIACADGFADCDGDSTNGCEVEIDTNNDIRTFHRDGDGDGVGSDTHVLFDCDGSGLPTDVTYVPNGGDCNDDDIEIYGGPNPHPEVCDGKDNDCDPSTDEATHATDAGGECPDSGEPGICKPGVEVCTSGTLECEPVIQPGTVAEVCDDLDNDCDGEVDEDATDATRYYPDSDGDNYGVSGNPTRYCPGDVPSGVAINWGDCDDGDPRRYPTNPETCDGVDNDCDTDVDEPGAQGSLVWYEDVDGDGFGDPNTATSQAYCAGDTTIPLNSPVSQAGDCNVNNYMINPNATEECGDGVDNNCDGVVDEGCPTGPVQRVGPLDIRRFAGVEIHNMSTSYSVCSDDKIMTHVKVDYFPSTWPVVSLNAGCEDVDVLSNQGTYSLGMRTLDYAGWTSAATSNNRAEYACPGTNQGIYRVDVNHGDEVVDSVQFTCRSYEIDQNTYAIEADHYNIPGPSPQFGPNGAYTDTSQCDEQDNKVAVGFIVEAGWTWQSGQQYKWAIRRVQLICQDIEAVLK
ncbi:hypothetical protein FIV42_14060 [Persicimonas caeni]|uniref:Uncharacterized protein n=1 Tax=Persicimonas caeni TaxID=2292766 RepID=A0A4Y6PVS1_PERCE|nr:putative metal-binding motif-containing protein [Persicimonas caeni]QDG51825.1 hypothetical protein FIV42_14060 [Persicimonas caeni]QED33046.1 hypothetical protein FRD00_14055 [Persicimonas caeni]